MKNSFKLRNLSIAALVGLAGFGATNSAQANETPITPTLGDDASYTLKEVSTPTDNSITLYKYDNTGITETINYEVNLKQTTYGEGNTSKVYDVNFINAPVTITTKYDSFNQNTRIENSSDNPINSIKGDFINQIYKGYSFGGAISNSIVLNDITGNFFSNSSSTGGAMHNDGIIGSITANFVGNSTNESYSYGGAISNADWVHSPEVIIDSITGDFIGNHTIGSSQSHGGAINNSGVINNITGNFIGNYAKGETGYTSTDFEIGSAFISGGAISNGNKIGILSGDFIANYVYSEFADTAGGALQFGLGKADSVSGDFIGNFAKSIEGIAVGGAISTWRNGGSYGEITSLRGNFIANNSSSVLNRAYGGAIYNKGVFGDLVGDFIQNNSSSNQGDAQGGAIYNAGTINHSGNFISNYVSSDSANAQGGAIYIRSAQEFGKVDAPVLPYIEMVILNEDGTVYKSLAIVMDSNGNAPITQRLLKEAIKNGTLTSFVKAQTVSISKAEFEQLCEQEGLTENEYFAMMEQESGDALIYGDPNDLFNSQGGETTLVTIEHQTLDSARANKASVTLKNSNILNNFASSKNGEAKGGAIYVEFENVKIEANDGEAYLISGNYTKNGDVIDDNAIYAKDSKVIFDVTNGSTIQLDDNINGENYETFIIGDNQSKFVLNNKIKNSTTHLVETNLYLTKDSHLDGNNLGLHSGTLNMINNQTGVSALNSLTVTGDTNVNVDVDLKNQTMDRFTASEYGSHSGNLNVAGMNLLSDAESDKTEILFAEQGLKDNVTNGITSQLPDDKYQTTLFTPIYKYNVSYDNREDAGYFVFTRPTTGGSSGGAPSVDTFNPAILGSSTSATVGAVGTINQTLNHVFNNADTYMNIPYLERISMRDRNKYAISVTGDATDMGRFSPLYQPSQEEASVWVKPYATFETVGLKNGPKVHNNTYGTLIGFDTEMQSIKRGWDRVFTGYIGYNGASQRYSGIDSTQNGGLLGGTMTLYKGNFFNATTVSVGASVANNQTMYGNEDFAMLLSGIGNKTGYNFEFKEGKLILQPSMLMSYTFVNTFDYTNAAGVRIDNKPLHALQLAPGVKVIGNLKGGWQPYASVSMVWNLMGESNATANGVKLPEMSIKPYVQYGVGVQKRIKDHFTAYGQAMVQNGGRNGVSLTAGFRWALGHDNCKYKVEDKQLRNNAAKQLRSDAAKQLRSDVVISSNNAIATPSARNDNGRKILKQMTPQQRAAYGGKYHNTTRTAKSGSLRQY